MEKAEFKLPSDEPEQLLVKSQEKTDPHYGCEPKKRNLEALLQYGVISLDKPSGPTSHEVVSWVRKILGISNAGHGGTLDPRVTGVLPCALGKSTRALSSLLTAGKEYIGVLYLHSSEERKRIEKIFKLFTGRIYQRPPLKSSVVRRIRVREIYYSEILEIENKRVLFKIGCEAGTYIRKYCYDIGEALCSGAHMLELRRTRVGNFKEDYNLITLQDLKDALTIFQIDGNDEYLKKLIFPMEKMVSHMPKIFIRDSAVDAISHGADLASAGICYIDARIKVNMMVAIMTLKRELVAFGRSLKNAMQIYKAKKGILVKTKKVFMERGIYPKWNQRK